MNQKKEIQKERDENKAKLENIKKEMESITKNLYKKKKWSKEDLL